jgi:tight adherence protein B
MDRLNRRFRRTRLGRWVERELTVAGIEQRPLTVVLAAAGVGLVAAYVLWTFLAPVFGILGVSIGGFALRAYIRRAKARRIEAFIVQMPELARVLANATNAGLSINTALAIAGEELAAPAGTELTNVANSLRFGTDLETALDDMGRRLPSREVGVLLSTLVVCSRSGGSLVTSLRDIADTLEDRKETRREIRTTLAQALATGYLVILLGIGMLFLLNMIQPGSVEAMTSNIVGQIALVISGSLFFLGFVVIRRMTRFDI